MRCLRVDRHGLVWSGSDERVLGMTPIEDLPLPMGSYLLSIRSSDGTELPYPVYISRSRVWDSGPSPVMLIIPDIAWVIRSKPPRSA